jgi:hypothetical protein
MRETATVGQHGRSLEGEHMSTNLPEGQNVPRCRNTGVTTPECGCHHCAMEMVRRYAPWVVGGGQASSAETAAA